ncbi:MAG: hypothetical protein AVO34_11580 [Firmicutes bacterium ML8_F2]|nr:MAG: hypothetical protein AVO34_11580 [Firmicutes bacterium ML8_F2]
MGQVLYFYHRDLDSELIDLLPRSEKEYWRADLAEKLLEPARLIEYYSYAIAYGVLHLLPVKHIERVRSYVDAGLYDDFVAAFMPSLSDSYISDGKFFYKGQVFYPPKGYTPDFRRIERGNILVDCVGEHGDTQTFRFVTRKQNKYITYRWELWQSNRKYGSY